MTERDPPIIPLDYLSGVKVVDFGDVRVARGLTRRAAASCPHKKIVYDQHERRIWCEDCERDLEGFDAFVSLVERYNSATIKLNERQKKLKESEGFQARSLAAKALDKAWTKRSSVPACPHCGQGLFPEDFKNGVRATLGRDYAEAMARKRRQEGRPK